MTVLPCLGNTGLYVFVLQLLILLAGNSFHCKILLLFCGMKVPVDFFYSSAHSLSFKNAWVGQDSRKPVAWYSPVTLHSCVEKCHGYAQSTRGLFGVWLYYSWHSFDLCSSRLSWKRQKQILRRRRRPGQKQIKSVEDLCLAMQFFVVVNSWFCKCAVLDACVVAAKESYWKLLGRTVFQLLITAVWFLFLCFICLCKLWYIC